MVSADEHQENKLSETRWEEWVYRSLMTSCLTNFFSVLPSLLNTSLKYISNSRYSDLKCQSLYIISVMSYQGSVSAHFFIDLKIFKK